MSRPSSIDRLPDDVKALIGFLRRQGRTIDEIKEQLKELSVTIPRSTLARKTKELDDLADMLVESREMAVTMVDRLSQDPAKATATARLNIELGQALVFKLLRSYRDDTVTLDGKEAALAMRALKDVMGAGKAVADLRAQLKAEADREAATKAGEAARELGLSADATDAIKKKILGLT